jgi:hypothetical protein
MNPTLRLAKRLMFYTFFSIGILLLLLFQVLAILLFGLHGVTLFTLLWTIYLVAVWRLLTKYMGGGELAKELKERGGRPIKVFRPGKKNYRFLKGLGWGYEWTNNIVVLVNPSQDKFSFTKHLFLLDPSSTDFSNQLLEVAVTNEKAFEEISCKVRIGERRASSDLRQYENAQAISETLADIMK